MGMDGPPSQVFLLPCDATFHLLSNRTDSTPVPFFLTSVPYSLASISLLHACNHFDLTGKISRNSQIIWERSELKMRFVQNSESLLSSQKCYQLWWKLAVYQQSRGHHGTFHRLWVSTSSNILLIKLAKGTFFSYSLISACILEMLC